jgi:3,4-dihydroxy 2-butanone 4-phosphate synthase/GTP cyclohydrolase II
MFEPLDTDPLRRVELAIEDIRAGRMVVLVDDEDRENEGDLVMAADAITPEAINFMATHGRGLICLTLTEDKVKQLELPMMVANNQSPYHTAFTVSIEAREGVSTGISAADRAQTIRAAIDPKAGPQDLVTPGHIFPLRARDGGVLVRTGQTEGSVDLAKMADLTPAGVICEIMNDDGTMARMPDLIEFGKKHNIRIVAVADLIRWRLKHEVLVKRTIDVQTPIGNLGEFRMSVYESLTDGKVHLALSRGDLSSGESVLTRVQAATHVVDVFGFQTSDSWLQIEMALKMIAEEDRGVFLSMNSAGQDSDAVIRTLRTHLGETPTEGLTNSVGDGALRELGTGAQILLDLGVHKMRLMTNNPRKIVGLEGFGLKMVERVPLEAPVSEDNLPFLRARRLELGHLLSSTLETNK